MRKVFGFCLMLVMVILTPMALADQASTDKLNQMMSPPTRTAQAEKPLVPVPVPASKAISAPSYGGNTGLAMPVSLDPLVKKIQAAKNIQELGQLMTKELPGAAYYEEAKDSLQAALEAKVKTFSYPSILGWLSYDKPYTISEGYAPESDGVAFIVRVKDTCMKAGGLFRPRVNYAKQSSLTAFKKSPAVVQAAVVRFLMFRPTTAKCDVQYEEHESSFLTVFKNGTYSFDNE